MMPFCAIYSTFIQRGYDQIIHDVALQNLPVIFCLDRAGLVGEDGATHHGVFDLAYMRAIPNMVVFAPRNEVELRNILYTAQLGLPYPIVIRYPRGRGMMIDWEGPFEAIEIGTGVCLQEGKNIAVLSIGTTAKNSTKALEDFPTVAHYDLRFAKPLDEKLLHKICANFNHIITIEDGVKKGGVGTAILEFMANHNYKNSIAILGINDNFIEHGTIDELQKINGIDSASIRQIIQSLS
jgi:1-deoxy-D-xylulose-5-phosphate synthase